MPTMDSLIQSGKQNVQDKLKEGVDKINAISDEGRGVVDTLNDIPGDLDPDLKEQINSARESARRDALQDLDDQRQSIIDKAKSDADTIRSDVTTKINDNQSMISRMEGIQSGYGQSDIASAKQAINDNTRAGQDLLSDLQNAVAQADQEVQSARSKLGG